MRSFEFIDELIRAHTERFERAVQMALGRGCSQCGNNTGRLLVERWPGLIDGIREDPSRPNYARIEMSERFRVVCESCATSWTGVET